MKQNVEIVALQTPNNYAVMITEIITKWTPRIRKSNKLPIYRPVVQSSPKVHLLKFHLGATLKCINQFANDFPQVSILSKEIIFRTDGTNSC